jgi:hypothetical protein
MAPPEGGQGEPADYGPDHDPNVFDGNYTEQ